MTAQRGTAQRRRRCPLDRSIPSEDGVGAGEDAEDLDVLAQRVLDHLVGQLERRLLVEADRLEVVAHVLLVE